MEENKHTNTHTRRNTQPCNNPPDVIASHTNNYESSSYQYPSRLAALLVMPKRAPLQVATLGTNTLKHIHTSYTHTLHTHTRTREEHPLANTRTQFKHTDIQLYICLCLIYERGPQNLTTPPHRSHTTSGETVRNVFQHSYSLTCFVRLIRALPSSIDFFPPALLRVRGSVA